MCMSSEPSVMSNTKLYVGRAEHLGKNVHVLAYQNTAESDVPNCMILPFPAKEPMGPANIIDTSKFDKFLDEIVESTREVLKGVYLNSKRLTLGFDDDLAQVFNSGSYAVVLASNPDQIVPALERVEEVKRPKITKEFMDKLGELYPEHQFAVCCWKGNIKPEPLLWWYEPTNPEVLFYPAMDAHDGNPPDLDKKVVVDTNLVTGTREKPSKSAYYSKVYYSQDISEIRHLLPDYARGTKVWNLLPNGDFTMKQDGILERACKGQLLPKVFEMTGWE